MSSVKVEYRKNRKKYQVTYYLDGWRKRPLFASKIEAQNFARKIELGLKPEDRDSISIESAVKRYYESASVKKNPNSRINDKRYLNLFHFFMTVHRGVHHLASVQLEDLEAFREWLPTRAEYEGKTIKMGASTVNRLLRVIKHFFKRHIQWRNLEENPCTYLEFLEAEENERRPMTRIEYELAFEKVPDWYRPILRFIYLTGAPPSCVARLTIADLNFNTRTFSLRRKKGAKAKWKVIHLPMTEEVFALFKEIRNGSSVLDESVFKDNRGCPLRADRISKVGNQAIRAAGLKGVTLYCLRHALAVELTEAHVPTELVRQAMGHASISTTQRYARGVRPQSIAHALQLVRGGNLVAEPKNDLRIKGGEKSS